MTKAKTPGRKPDMIVWFAPEREGAPWLRIGAAWAHKSGKGFTQRLEAFPIAPGDIVLLEPKGDGSEPPTETDIS